MFVKPLILLAKTIMCHDLIRLHQMPKQTRNLLITFSVLLIAMVPVCAQESDVTPRPAATRSSVAGPTASPNTAASPTPTAATPSPTSNTTTPVTSPSNPPSTNTPAEGSFQRWFGVGGTVELPGGYKVAGPVWFVLVVFVGFVLIMIFTLKLARNLRHKINDKFTMSTTNWIIVLLISVIVVIFIGTLMGSGSSQSGNASGNPLPSPSTPTPIPSPTLTPTPTPATPTPPLLAICPCVTVVIALVALIGLWLQFRTFNSTVDREAQRRSEETISKLYLVDIDIKKSMIASPAVRDLMFDDPSGDKYKKLNPTDSGDVKLIEQVKLLCGVYGNFFEHYLFLESNIIHPEKDSIKTTWRGYIQFMADSSYAFRQYIHSTKSIWNQGIIEYVEAARKQKGEQ